MSKLTEKVALVTGGSRGIGAAIAKRLAADGASVAITYAKDASAASAVVKAIERDGGKAIAIQADAADAEAVKSAIEKAVAAFSGLNLLNLLWFAAALRTTLADAGQDGWGAAATASSTAFGALLLLQIA